MGGHVLTRDFAPMLLKMRFQQLGFQAESVSQGLQYRSDRSKGLPLGHAGA
jgi:hypothetical protein